MKTFKEFLAESSLDPKVHSKITNHAQELDDLLWDDSSDDDIVHHHAKALLKHLPSEHKATSHLKNAIESRKERNFYIRNDDSDRAQNAEDDYRDHLKNAIKNIKFDKSE